MMRAVVDRIQQRTLCLQKFLQSSVYAPQCLLIAQSVSDHRLIGNHDRQDAG
jgi:hypothetical protein